MTELVEIESGDIPADGLWKPQMGPTTKRFLDGTGLDQSARRVVQERAVSVLGACLPPDQRNGGRRTGLVVGHVQSGKTQSFTALTALARDAGYPLVILLAGTKRNLHRQTADRLREDLHKNGGSSHWILVEGLSESHPKRKQVESLLSTGTSISGASKRPRTVAVTVMKNPSSLKKLASVLEQFKASGALDPEVPILVIDDEADQAGLNASSTDTASATYRAISDLREAAGTHNYVMYTATPQAPLLLGLSDMLSPDFVRVLTPGEAYTGGGHFFGEARDDFVRLIPATEVSSITSGEVENLPTLEIALGYFLLSVVAEQPDSARSMLVHPSRTTTSHEAVERWIYNRLRGLVSAIKSGGDDRQDAMDLVFRPAWEDLASTVDNLEPLERLVDQVPELFETEFAVRTVNSATGAGQEIDWYEASAWILVGGFKLDRGFTIEGLTVTYMPRGIGVGNADSIQQRARFFGYKGAYADYCRGWFEAELERAYVAYVEHERHLLEELHRVEREATGLKSWKRRMLLAPELKPCRGSVVSLPLVRSALRGDGWVQFGETRPGDFDTLSAVVERLPWIEGSRHERDSRPHVPDGSAHVSLMVTAHDALAYVLGEWLAYGVDAARLYQLAIVLANIADANAELPVELVRMDGGAVRKRKFTPGRNTRAENLQVGRSVGYAGDKDVKTEGCLTIQFHTVTDTGGSGELMMALAIWVPKLFASGLIYEDDE